MVKSLPSTENGPTTCRLARNELVMICGYVEMVACTLGRQYFEMIFLSFHELVTKAQVSTYLVAGDRFVCSKRADLLARTNIAKQQ